MIKVRGLTKTYTYNGKKATILNNIDFDIYSGESIAILGANGAGKSTLVKVIAGEIIALLIQMDTEDLIILLESPETLDKVVASAATLFYNKKKEMKIIKEKEIKEMKLNKSKNTNKRRRNEKNCIIM
jgi:ABC-type phosphate/phosphonate transport system ATPase subunit